MCARRRFLSERVHRRLPADGSDEMPGKRDGRGWIREVWDITRA